MPGRVGYGVREGVFDGAALGVSRGLDDEAVAAHGRRDCTQLDQQRALPLCSYLFGSDPGVPPLHPVVEAFQTRLRGQLKRFEYPALDRAIARAVLVHEIEIRIL